MAQSRLTPLQVRILTLLAGIDPAWTLVGGGALVGFHTHHRDTRDLDLFFRPQRALSELPGEVTRRLEAAGLTVLALQSAPAFCRLEVRADALEAAGLPYAIGGALALAIAGVPRGTAEVDLNVFVDDARVPEARGA